MLYSQAGCFLVSGIPGMYIVGKKQCLRSQTVSVGSFCERKVKK